MADAETPKKAPHKFAFVCAGDLDDAKNDPEEGSREPESWLEELKPPIGDELLKRLRQIFTITYRNDYSEGAEERMLGEIRKLATDALQPFDAALRVLRQKPLGADPPERDGVRVYMFVVASVRDLSRKVTVESTKKKARFIDLVDSAPADAILIVLRRIASLTFSEVFAKKDRRRLLWDIRHIAADALAPLNQLLEAISWEPVAIPTRPFPQDDDPEDVGEPAEV